MTAGQLQHEFISQLNAVLNELQLLRSRSRYRDLSDQPQDEVMHFITRARSVIHRVAGRTSTYFVQCEEIVHRNNSVYGWALLLAGVVSSLRHDVSAGYLQSLIELTRSELFSDFLDMSQHLFDHGYKDAAAVIAGSSLEAHLRQLCQKAEIDTETEKSEPKKADRLNAELAGSNVYPKLDQKNVTAWLDLRNKAAHGHYDQYESGQVALLIAGVRDFITRYPA